MLELLKIEYKKIIPYTTFWVIFGLVFSLTPLVFYGIGQFKIQGLPVDMASTYRFPDVWNNLTYLASWFNLLIGMCVVILVCNEFSFKTFRQNVIDGQSKADFIISKILLMTSFALFSTLYLLVVGALFGFISGSSGDGLFFKDISYLAIYGIQALGYMSVGLLIAVLIRTTALSIIIFLFSILIESILQFFVPAPLDKYFPMEIIANLTPNPLVTNMMNQVNQGAIQGVQPPTMFEQIPLSTTVGVAIVYILVFWGVSYFILTKKDIR